MTLQLFDSDSPRAGTSRTWRSARRACVATVAGLLVVLGAATANAAALFSKDVLCGMTKCGTMEIDRYDSVNPSSVTSLAGVEIKGSFKPTAGKDYHYVQAITKDNADTSRWFNDTSVAIPVPYLDTPPGGYKVEDAAGSQKYTIEQPFDYLPWYDEGDFPAFFDRPTDRVQKAKLMKDGTVTLDFETWIVCTIEDVHNDNKIANDDRYKIAPLLGWTWGFDIVYKDVENIGKDDLADFTLNKRAFNFVMNPSAAWTQALGTVYGAGAKKDSWNITVGDCKECVATPEPSAVLLLLSGLPAVAALRRRLRVPGRANQ